MNHRGHMKRRLLILALAGCGAALPVALSVAAQAATSSPGEAKQQVLDVTEQWVAAENKHDAAALGHILDDQFISTFAANSPIGKDAFIKGITKGEVDPTQSQSLTDEQVVVEGDTAIITGIDTFHSAVKTPIPPMRFTITYVRRQGQWRALAEHIVAIPAKQ